jgi:hypothetical protein
MVMYLQFGLVLIKLRFGACFVIVLVPKPRRVNLVFFYALESFFFFELLLSIFRIFIVGSPNDPQ